MPDDKSEKAGKAPDKAVPDRQPDGSQKQAPPSGEELKAPPVPEGKKQEQAATGEKSPVPDKTAPSTGKEDGSTKEKAANVSVYNFSEIMAEKKTAEKPDPSKTEKAPEQSGASPKVQKDEKGKMAEPPKRRGRSSTEDKTKAPAQGKKAAAPKKETKGTPEKSAKPAPPKKAVSKGSAGVKPPVQTAPAPPEPPQEAPRRGEEQIVYLKLDELHAFKNHPFQVRDDEEMRAMVSSVKDKGVTQPAIVRPREDGGYEIVSGHRRQKASELAGYADMPCIVRNLTDDEAITQMVEDNLNQREEILPSEKAKALKMQLEAIKHQGARTTSGQIDPKDSGKRSNEIVAERNKMAVKQVQRFIRLNELVPDLIKLVDDKKIGFTTAVELSYIGKKNQNYIAVSIDSQQASPTQAQAKRMRELEEKKLLNGDVIDGIMMEDKKEVDKVILTGAELGKYFGAETTPREMKDQIMKLLDDWKGQTKEHEKPEKKADKEK